MVRAASRKYTHAAKRANAGAGGSGRGSGSGRATATASTVTRQGTTVPAGSTGLADLIASQLSQPQSVAASVPAEPAFSARNRLALPQGYGGGVVTGGGGAAPPQTSLADQLRQIHSLAGPAIQHPQVSVSSSSATATAGKGGKVTKGPGGVPKGARHVKGVAHFEGKPVAGWIKPWLVYARKHGWKGTVSSGYRSYADQVRIYNSGVRPAAKPGQSNHEGANFPRGAVDVTDAAQLARILRRARSPLIYAGAKDPVHFSHPHNGGY
jgi:hypothetical protein